jgi:hypothetical protein
MARETINQLGRCAIACSQRIGRKFRSAEPKSEITGGDPEASSTGYVYESVQFKQSVQILCGW